MARTFGVSLATMGIFYVIPVVHRYRTPVPRDPRPSCSSLFCGDGSPLTNSWRDVIILSHLFGALLSE